MELPTFSCPGCQCVTVLPYHQTRGARDVEHYWPESGNLTVVCHRCGTAHNYREDEIERRLVPPPESDRGFWLICLPCAGMQCSETIVAHTITHGQTSQGEPGMQVARSHPALTCARGHVTAAEPYPLRLDFIEWSGGEEYLT